MQSNKETGKPKEEDRDSENSIPKPAPSDEVDEDHEGMEAGRLADLRNHRISFDDAAFKNAARMRRASATKP